MDKKSKKKTNNEKIYSLCEAVADIAYAAGYRKFYSGDSRQDISDFIEWSKEFEEKWKGKEWGADDTNDDYMDEVVKFANENINIARIFIKKNG